MKLDILRMVLCVMLLALIPVSGEAVNEYGTLQLTIDNSISFETELQKEYSVENFVVSSYFYPQSFNGSQELNGFTSSHENYEIEARNGVAYLKFLFNDTTLKEEVTIENTFDLRSDTYRPIVDEKAPYPISYVSSKNQKYLDFVGFINSNEAIKEQASKLAEGEDDVFIIAAKVAKWIREDVNYNLSTVTQNPDQSSTEVFKSKSGVCREITNLFISMMRELGIPARVVTGYAYTENDDVSNFIGSNWGGHAWAEVLVGDTWVPFDLTYDQYGYVDASHLVLDKSTQIRENSVILNGTGRGFNLVSGSLKTSSQFSINQSFNETDSRNLNLTINGPKELGFGSHGYLKATIENNNDYYSIAFLNIAGPEEISIQGKKERMIPLRPQKEQTVYFRYQLPEDLDENYEYTFPIQLYSPTFSTTYTITSRASFSSLTEDELPNPEREETNKTLEKTNNSLPLRCHIRPQQDQTANLVVCQLRNPNNYVIENLSVCMDENTCKEVTLHLNDRQDVTFQTEREQTTVSYEHRGTSEETKAELQNPELSYSLQVDENEVTVEYAIDDYHQGTSVSVYEQDQRLISGEEETDTLSFTMEEGTHDLSIRLQVFNRSISENSETVEITSSALSNEDNIEQSWIRSAITWLLSLIP